MDLSLSDQRGQKKTVESALAACARLMQVCVAASARAHAYVHSGMRGCEFTCTRLVKVYLAVSEWCLVHVCVLCPVCVKCDVHVCVCVHICLPCALVG